MSALLRLSLSFVAAGLLGGAAAAQEAAAPGASAPELDRLLEAAREGRAVVRPQAARRLVRYFEGLEGADQRAAVLERLREECGDTIGELAAQGPALIEVLGELGDEDLRARLWAALDDPEFPWRPYAMRSLAESARPGETERFLAYCADDVAPVRAAALGAFEDAAQEPIAAAATARLADEDDRVRRAAADLLARSGEERALYHLVEELRRTDTFLDRPTGEQAAYEARRLLGEHLEAALAYDPAKPPDDAANRAVLRELEQAIEQRSGAPAPELPSAAQAGGPIEGVVLGLELRSCRRGEFFLRWTRSDELLVGLGNPARVPLPAGTAERLLATAAERLAELGDRRFHGEPGCDVEHFHWRPDPAGSSAVWVVSKGPETVEGLRPEALGRLYARLLETLPAGSATDPRLDHLRSRAEAAARSIGGALPSD